MLVYLYYWHIYMYFLFYKSAESTVSLNRALKIFISFNSHKNETASKIKKIMF